MPLDHTILDDLENRIQTVKVEYDQYFMGINRTAPLEDQEKIRKLIMRLKGQHTVNTAVKFRFNSLVSRFNTFDRQWNRMLREIEEGRSSRDRFRARLASRTPTTTSPAAQAKSAAGKGDDEKLNKLYKQYVMARLECNQPVDNISKEQLAKSIEKSMPALKKQYKNKDFEFKVVVEGGKAKLKAVSKGGN